MIEEDASVIEAVKHLIQAEDVITFFNKIYQKIKTTNIDKKKIKEEVLSDQEEKRFNTFCFQFAT